MSRITKLLALLALAAGGITADGLHSFSVSCPSSGNKPLSSTSLPVKFYSVMGAASNTGYIYLGDSTVTATAASSFGYLAKGVIYTVPPAGTTDSWNLSGVYFACSSSGDYAAVAYGQ